MDNHIAPSPEPAADLDATAVAAAAEPSPAPADEPALSLAQQVHLVIAFCTRLPRPLRAPPPPPGALAAAMRLFPIAGIVVGLTGALAYGAANAVLPPLLAGLLAVAATVAVTGALHEDGLADMADGFGGGRDRAAKLAIMRDSRIGSYGVVTLVLTLALRAGALASLGRPELVAGALIAAHAFGRAAIPAVMRVLPPARGDGLGATCGLPSANTAGVAALLAGVIALVALPLKAAAAGVVGALVGAAAVALLARKQIGGQTGDVLGAVEQVAETAVLLAVVGVLG